MEEDKLNTPTEELIYQIFSSVEDFWKDFCPVNYRGKKILSVAEFYRYTLLHTDNTMEEILTDLLSLKGVSKIRNIPLYFLLFTTKIYNRKHDEV
jgi:hypothetical protein